MPAARQVSRSPLIALAVAVDGVRVDVRGYPVGASVLPEAIALTLSDEWDELAQVRSRHDDNFMRLPPFTGIADERFEIAIELGDLSHIETFEI